MPGAHAVEAADVGRHQLIDLPELASGHVIAAGGCDPRHHDPGGLAAFERVLSLGGRHLDAGQLPEEGHVVLGVVVAVALLALLLRRIVWLARRNDPFTLATVRRLPLHWFLVGFGLLAVAEVVKRGCAMRDELDTVV